MYGIHVIFSTTNLCLLGIFPTSTFGIYGWFIGISGIPFQPDFPIFRLWEVPCFNFFPQKPTNPPIHHYESWNIRYIDIYNLSICILISLYIYIYIHTHIYTNWDGDPGDHPVCQASELRLFLCRSLQVPHLSEGLTRDRSEMDWFL